MTAAAAQNSCKLSVILPCFNGAETIALQLEALVRQDWPEGSELIVVNNGSTDRSIEIVERFRGRVPNLSIVEAHMPGTPRLPVGHSYNTGIKAATGDAFVFCEADDEVAAGWLRAMGRALKDHDFVVARLDHRKLNADWFQPVAGEGYQSEGLFQMGHHPYLLAASGCGFGISRTLYQTVGPLSAAFPIVADIDYCWRSQLAGYALHFEPEALIYYREKSSHKARFRQGRSWGRDTTRLLRHYGAPQRRFAFARQLLAIARSMPHGLVAVLALALRRPGARPLFGQWIWDLGWFTGKLSGIVSKDAASPGGRSGTGGPDGAARRDAVVPGDLQGS